jgi:phospholipase C
MTRKQLWKSTGASLAMASMTLNTLAATASCAAEPAITLATTTTSIGEQYANLKTNETKLTKEHKLALVRQKIKYVFVLFQENRSFDGYFGTYPGANGLTSTYPGADPADPAAMPANQTASYTENLRNTRTAATARSRRFCRRAPSSMSTARPFRSIRKACIRSIIPIPATSPISICRTPTSRWR